MTREEFIAFRRYTKSETFLKKTPEKMRIYSYKCFIEKSTLTGVEGEIFFIAYDYATNREMLFLYESVCDLLKSDVFHKENSEFPHIFEKAKLAMESGYIGVLSNFKSN